MNQAQAKKLVKKARELVERWGRGYCEIEGVRKHLESLYVCVRCGRVVGELHGMTVDRNQISGLIVHPSVVVLLVCIKNWESWWTLKEFGGHFANYYENLIGMLNFSSSGLWRFYKSVEVKLRREGADLKWYENYGFYKFFSIKIRLKKRGWGLMAYPDGSSVSLGKRVWLCEDCVKKLQIEVKHEAKTYKDVQTLEDLKQQKLALLREARKTAEERERERIEAQRIIETARLMAKDITRKELEEEARRKEKEAADVDYKREKTAEAQRFINNKDYKSAIRVLEDWRYKRPDLFHENAQRLLREAVGLEARTYKRMMMDRAREYISRKGRSSAIRFLEDWEGGRAIWHGWGASYSYFPQKDLFDQDARTLLLELKQQEKEEQRRKKEEQRRKKKEDEEKLNQVRAFIKEGRLQQAEETLDTVYTYPEPKKELKKRLEESEKTDRIIRVASGTFLGLIGAPITVALAGWGELMRETLCLSVVAIIGAILGAWSSWYFTVQEDDSYSSSGKAPILNLNKMDGIVRMIVAGFMGLAPSATLILIIAAIVASCS